MPRGRTALLYGCVGVPAPLFHLLSGWYGLASCPALASSVPLATTRIGGALARTITLDHTAFVPLAVPAAPTGGPTPFLLTRVAPAKSASDKSTSHNGLPGSFREEDEDHHGGDDSDVHKRRRTESHSDVLDAAYGGTNYNHGFRHNDARLPRQQPVPSTAPLVLPRLGPAALVALTVTSRPQPEMTAAGPESVPVNRDVNDVYTAAAATPMPLEAFLRGAAQAVRFVVPAAALHTRPAVSATRAAVKQAAKAAAPPVACWPYRRVESDNDEETDSGDSNDPDFDLSKELSADAAQAAAAAVLTDIPVLTPRALASLFRAHSALLSALAAACDPDEEGRSRASDATVTANTAPRVLAALAASDDAAQDVKHPWIESVIAYARVLASAGGAVSPAVTAAAAATTLTRARRSAETDKTAAAVAAALDEAAHPVKAITVCWCSAVRGANAERTLPALLRALPRSSEASAATDTVLTLGNNRFAVRVPVTEGANTGTPLVPALLNATLRAIGTVSVAIDDDTLVSDRGQLTLVVSTEQVTS